MKGWVGGLIVGLALGVVGTLAVVGVVVALLIWPRTIAASEDARMNSVRSTLQTVRSEIELFKIQHGDVPPAPVGMWGILMGRSNANEVRTSGATGTYGPYLQAEPINAMNGQTVVGTAPSPKVGWVYTVKGNDYKLEAVNAKGDGVLME